MKPKDDRESIALKVYELVNSLGDDPESQEYASYLIFMIISQGIAEAYGVDTLDQYIDEVKQILDAEVN